MKFAKELEREAVPEWRIKYLNYKAGKKYVKAVGRAFNRANATPRSLAGPSPSHNLTHTPRSNRINGQSAPEGLTQSGLPPRRQGTPSPGRHAPIDVANSREDDSLKGDGGNEMHYGSFVPTPTEQSPISQRDSRDLVLPGPAIPSPPEHLTPSPSSRILKGSFSRKDPQRSTSMAAVPTKASHELQGQTKLTGLTRKVGITESPSQLRRLFSHSPGLRRDGNRNSFGLQPFDLVREREREFYEFMDSELEKVDGFYKFKEQQAGERLQILRRQLHEMRNRRMIEMYDSVHERDHAESRHSENGHGQHPQGGWISPLKAKFFPPGPNTRALRNMAQTPRLTGEGGRAGVDQRRDYSRRTEDSEVSYRTAKRKLKLALQEFYRGLELLKSYAILNRTAFRKLNKKFDKAAHARPPYRYMTEKVNHSWFVTSDVLESLIKDAEDLYARYFERGNYKLAAGKLRSLSKVSKDDSGSSFLNGFYIGTGVVFTVQGLVYGIQMLFDGDRELRTHTSYLLQLYGGYFLMLTLFSLFCLNCFIWTTHKVNYPFIFEFDMRHHVDWRRLAEFPSFCLLLFGIFIWVNFSRYGPESLYLYYPVMLIGLTVAIIFLPAPVLAYRSRQWFVYSHWRLLLAGIYPVEFRDFFLGDIYCSLTYATANIELFFCLYGSGWDNPAKCNSNHSRAMGFLSALPPIWRFLQCIRRYRDTCNVFPHLVNAGKYAMTIIAAVTLSIYRIQNSHTNLAVFILFSTVNGVYCSIWDLFMDFSLLQSQSRHRFLRDILALKSRWPYYSIMIIDPILRFGWIFYAIFTHDAQHSTVVSFVVALMEVVRRGMWTLFRVENEHCANVSQYKASRDVPLPYRIEPLMGRASSESSPTLLPSADPSSARMTNDTTIAVTDDDPERQGATGSSTAIPPSGSAFSRLRHRSQNTLAKSFSKILAEAHKQDFEKRRKPADQEVEEEEARHGGPSDDEMDGEDDDDVHSPSRGSDGEEEDERNYTDMREVEDLVRRGTAR